MSRYLEAPQVRSYPDATREFLRVGGCPESLADKTAGALGVSDVT